MSELSPSLVECLPDLVRTPKFLAVVMEESLLPFPIGSPYGKRRTALLHLHNYEYSRDKRKKKPKYMILKIVPCTEVIDVDPKEVEAVP